MAASALVSTHASTFRAAQGIAGPDLPLRLAHLLWIHRLVWPEERSIPSDQPERQIADLAELQTVNESVRCSRSARSRWKLQHRCFSPLR